MGSEENGGEKSETSENWSGTLSSSSPLALLPLSRGHALGLLSRERAAVIPKEEGVGSEETTPPQARLFGRALLPLSRGPCAVVEGLRSFITHKH